jgi:hypothetical protein
MEELPEVTRIIQTDTRLVREATSGELDPVFRDQFNSCVFTEIANLTQDFAELPPTTYIEEEGTVGILPPPARKIVARDLLTGSRPSPLRIYDEEVEVGPPERIVDKITFLVINEIDTATIMDPKQISAVIKTLRATQELVERLNKDQRISSPDMGVGVTEAEAYFCLIRNGVMGDITSEKLALNSSQDLMADIRNYQASLSSVLRFDPTRPPTSSALTHGILAYQLRNDIHSSGIGEIVIPLVVYPKGTKFNAGGRITYFEEALTDGRSSIRVIDRPSNIKYNRLDDVSSFQIEENVDGIS